MKAVVLNEYGGPDNLVRQDKDKPEVGPNDALVKVSRDLGQLGRHRPAQRHVRRDAAAAARFGLRRGGRRRRNVGAGVRDFVPGDEVYYAIDLMDRRGGANAEYHVTDASRLAKKPANLSFEEAAAVPVAGGTAYAALFTSAGLGLGDSVLIHGAAGGVGTYAVQLAKAAGAHVFATCGGYDADLVKSLGADVVIDYKNEDFVETVNRETAGAGVEVVFDAAGGQLVKSIAVVRMDGQLVTVTGAGGDLSPAMRKNATVRFVHLEDAKQKLDKMRALFERGQLRSVIGKTFPLEQRSPRRTSCWNKAATRFTAKSSSKWCDVQGRRGQYKQPCHEQSVAQHHSVMLNGAQRSERISLLPYRREILLHCRSE